MLLSKKKKPVSNKVLSKLKEVEFLQIYADNDSVITKISALCKRKRFRKGASIIKEGEYGDELFVFLTGKIEIVKVTLQGEHYTLSTLDSGSGGIYVGESALIDNDKRSATVIAKTECECLVIKRNDFIDFGDRNPEIGLNITRAIARKLSKMHRKTNADVITLFSALVEEIGGSN